MVVCFVLPPAQPNCPPEFDSHSESPVSNIILLIKARVNLSFSIKIENDVGSASAL